MFYRLLSMRFGSRPPISTCPHELSAAISMLGWPTDEFPDRFIRVNRDTRISSRILGAQSFRDIHSVVWLCH